MHLPEQDLNHVLEHTQGIWEDLRGERIFITGGTGFVGTWLVQSFLWANQRFNLKAKTVVLSRKPALTSYEAIEFLIGDGVSFGYPEGTFAFLVHAANDQSFSGNVHTTARVLDFAATHGTNRLLFTSSGAIYGTQPPEMTYLYETYCGAPLTTDIHSSYGQAKRASEFLCAEWGAVIARLFAFVGPHLPLNANYAVGNFIGSVLRAEPIQITGDGTPYRSYLYAADLAIWIWTLLLRGQRGRAYNVGSPAPVSIADVAQTVVENTRPGTPIMIAGTPQAGVVAARYVPSVERAEQELGLRVLISLADGIRRTYRWHVQ